MSIVVRWWIIIEWHDWSNITPSCSFSPLWFFYILKEKLYLFISKSNPIIFMKIHFHKYCFSFSLFKNKQINLSICINSNRGNIVKKKKKSERCGRAGAHVIVAFPRYLLRYDVTRHGQRSGGKRRRPSN